MGRRYVTGRVGEGRGRQGRASTAEYYPFP
jgi:hypothetical protein